MCSAEYFGNNLCNPVMFHDAVNKIPEKAVVIEISAHGVMQVSLLLAPNCTDCRCKTEKLCLLQKNSKGFANAVSK